MANCVKTEGKLVTTLYITDVFPFEYLVSYIVEIVNEY